MGIRSDDTSDEGDSPRDYVQGNKEFLSRILARGDAEAQAYALAVISRGGSRGDIDEIQRLLEDMKTEDDS